jgi:hypothetical protein
MMASALPVLTSPALNVNTESRMFSWHLATCQQFSRIKNVMADIRLIMAP